MAVAGEVPLLAWLHDASRVTAAARDTAVAAAFCNESLLVVSDVLDFMTFNISILDWSSHANAYYPIL
jgi:hypothetical protein